MAAVVRAKVASCLDALMACNQAPPDPDSMAPLEAWAYRRRVAAQRDAVEKPSSESGEYRLVRVACDSGQGWSFCSNFVRTSKYTVVTFLPLFLRNAFNPYLHSANTFFLVVCAMQCVPYITYTAIITLFGVEMGTPTTLLPLGFVVTVDAIFQALEDTTRHNADYEANNSPTRLVDPTSGAVVDAPWRDVRVGDLVVVRNRGGTRGRHSQLQRLLARPVFHSFRLMFGRAIISRNGLEAWMLFFGTRARGTLALKRRCITLVLPRSGTARSRRRTSSCSASRRRRATASTRTSATSRPSPSTARRT